MTENDIPDDMTRDEYRRLTDSDIHEETPLANDKPAWWKRVLTPTFRRWAYGVSIAAVGVYAAVTNQPEIVAVAGPLILALFYVDSNGDPR